MGTVRLNERVKVTDCDTFVPPLPVHACKQSHER